MIAALQDFWGNQGCVIVQPYDMEIGAGTFILPLFYALWVLNPGEPLTFSLAAVRQMVGMVIIQTVCSIIINFK